MLTFFLTFSLVSPIKTLRNPDPEPNLVFSYQMHGVYERRKKIGQSFKNEYFGSKRHRHIANKNKKDSMQNKESTNTL